MLDVPTLLLTSLEELTEDQLKTFQSKLTSGRMLGFPPIPKRQLRNTDIQITVDQMVERYGPERAVEITLMILRWINQHDLPKKLQSRLSKMESSHNRELIVYIQGEYDPSGLFILVITILEELTEDQLKTFQSNLTSGWMLGFPPIPKSQLRNTDIQVTVDQMVERYGPEGAVGITLMILRWMNRHDVAEKLERDHTRENVSNVPSNKDNMI
uniref:Uncharacterized LOC115178540 n=1 Tax=Salmo trutta TaxID=8032 RepID=A0A674C013_SALTR